MKKFLKVIFFVLLVGGGILAYSIYLKNLPGIGPKTSLPSKDIVKSVDVTGIPLRLPPEFSISVFAKGLKDPRVMVYDPAGNLLVSIPLEGEVVVLPDRNGDGQADKIITVAQGLNRPHGLAFKCIQKNCKLIVAESHQVVSYDYDEKLLAVSNKKKIIDLPNRGEHFTRTIMFMPEPNENKLLVSVGSSCNVCHEKDDKRAKILAVDVDSGKSEIFASGLRNSVFMTAHPVTGKIWATEMGRDFLGDNLPPDEINIIEEGRNYGWPVCYGKNIHDTDFDKNIYVRNPCSEPFETPSYIDIPAHSAPLGLAFVPEQGWPKEYWHNLLVAYHGSWNRSERTGYKIVRYELNKEGRLIGKQTGENFIDGWLAEDTKVLGRPADLLALPNGALLISDDKNGIIYKVAYQHEK